MKKKHYKSGITIE